MGQKERYILHRIEDRKWFCDPIKQESGFTEWTTNRELARQWLDLDSCTAAAQVWLEVHGEILEVEYV